jgi:hypothetical protein
MDRFMTATAHMAPISFAQNCNLELSHAHIHYDESCDSPSGHLDAANSLLGLINPLFGAN